MWSCQGSHADPGGARGGGVRRCAARHGLGFGAGLRVADVATPSPTTNQVLLRRLVTPFGWLEPVEAHHRTSHQHERDQRPESRSQRTSRLKQLSHDSDRSTFQRWRPSLVGTVALSDHPVRLPPLRRSKTTDHRHGRAVRALLGALPRRRASTLPGFPGAFGRYDLKLWIGSGDGSAAYLPG